MCLELFQIVQLKKSYFYCLRISNRKYDELESTLNNQTEKIKFSQRNEIWEGMIWIERF